MPFFGWTIYFHRTSQRLFSIMRWVNYETRKTNEIDLFCGPVLIVIERNGTYMEDEISA